MLSLKRRLLSGVIVAFVTLDIANRSVDLRGFRRSHPLGTEQLVVGIDTNWKTSCSMVPTGKAGNAIDIASGGAVRILMLSRELGTIMTLWIETTPFSQNRMLPKSSDQLLESSTLLPGWTIWR